MLFYLLQAIFSFFLVVFAGRFILSFVRIERESPLFYNFLSIFAGFYGLIGLFSIIKTGGISISTFLVIWALLALWKLKIIKKPTFQSFFKLDKKIVLESTLVLSILVLANYFKFFGFSHSTAVVNNWDALSDVTRSIFLNYTGIENTNTNFIQLPAGSQPYHYFEAWAVAFFASIFKSNYWITQGLVFHPIVLTLIYFGFRALTFAKTTRFFSVLFSVALFFTSGLVNDSILNIDFFEWCIPLRNNIMDEPWWTRMSVLYPPILLSFYWVLQHKWSAAIFTLLLLPFLSVTPAIPTISSVFGVLVLCAIFSTKRKAIFKLLWIPVLAAAFYQGFYLLFKDHSEFIALPTLSDILAELSNKGVIKTKIIIIAEKIIQTILLYSPFLLLILIGIVGKKENFLPKKWAIERKVILLYIGVITIVSLTMWQILNFIFGASFFYYYTMIPLFNILLTYSVCIGIQSQKRILQSVMLFSFIGLNCYFINRSISIYITTSKSYYTKRYDKHFLQKVEKIWNEKIDEKELALGVKFEDHSEIIHPFFNDGLSLCGYYIYGIANAPALISLSRGDMPEAKMKENAHSENFTKHTSFYQYVQRQPRNENIDINSIKKKFIQEYTIRFGVATPKGTIPEELKDLIDVVITDPTSGERFIVFKKMK